MAPTITAWWAWAGFFGFVLVMLAADLFLFGGRVAHKVTLREAAAWSLAWIGLAFAFTFGLWWYLAGVSGPALADRRALEFLTGYLIEKSLAVDNVFVWLLLFQYFAVPAEYQRRVLLYGVLGAIVLRTAMIVGGAWLIAQFHWLLYVFGAFLVLTGVKMLVFADEKPDLDNNPVVRWLRAHLRLTAAHQGDRFFVVLGGIRYATPLLLVLVLVELSDVIFAVDSIPAIFAVTDDPYIVLTSNLFAILGLRAMYFLVADVANRFEYLKYGLALVLVFVGGKMLVAPWVQVPVLVSLATVAAILATAMVVSLRRTRPGASYNRSPSSH
jgi:tellurite resistance protein TerC